MHITTSPTYTAVLTEEEMKTLRYTLWFAYKVATESVMAEHEIAANKARAEAVRQLYDDSEDVEYDR